MDTALISALVTGILGIITIVVNQSFARNSSKRDDLSKYRSELQTDLKACYKEVNDLRKEVDTAQSKFYDTRDELNALRYKHERCMEELKICKAELKGKDGTT